MSNYTKVSISLSGSLTDESRFMCPLLSRHSWFSGVLNPSEKLKKLSLRNDDFWIRLFSACRLSLARCNNSLLCFCLSTYIRREQLILNMVTILDISDFSSALLRINSTVLGSGWSLAAMKVSFHFISFHLFLYQGVKTPYIIREKN